MFSQLEEEVCYVRWEGFWTVPVKNSDGGVGMNDGIPKMNFGRREVKDRRYAKGNEAEGLKVRE